MGMEAANPRYANVEQRAEVIHHWWGHHLPGKNPVAGAGKSSAEVRHDRVEVEGATRQVVCLWPPDATGVTFMAFEVRLPQKSALLRLAMYAPDSAGLRDSGGTVNYAVRVISKETGDKLLWHKRYGGAGWTPTLVNLTPYAGREVILRLANTWDRESGGYRGPACWGQLEIPAPG